MAGGADGDGLVAGLVVGSAVSSATPGPPAASVRALAAGCPEASAGREPAVAAVRVAWIRGSASVVPLPPVVDSDASRTRLRAPAARAKPPMARTIRRRRGLRCRPVGRCQRGPAVSGGSVVVPAVAVSVVMAVPPRCARTPPECAPAIGRLCVDRG
ncbi:hypothetical protein CP978_21230 [Streptomyces nodosus]|uniref:Uncharacterized protein n=1 Tax=Streptomyces nodosus TaxID=40318 RepID=A0A5P2W8V0_9ACTN|nr:hypothetical protein CP978_21230 [Streptomyces nodosus]